MIDRFPLRALWLLLFLPDSVFAFSPDQSLHSFINGVLHPVFVSAHLLLLIAVGLLFGQQGTIEILTAVKILFISTLVGLAASWFSIEGKVEMLLLSEVIIVGLLIAAKPTLALYWYSVIGAFTGFFLGLDTAQDTPIGINRLISLFGSLVGIIAVMLHPMAFADYFKKRSWQKIAIRIVGSWLSASALLVLALSISTK